MIKKPLLLLISALTLSCSNSIELGGIVNEVEVLRDNYGINHIYANNQNDLFFMQVYLAAKDRLFQFEIWRRQATGTVSEIFGEDELERDIGTRLFKFRGDIKDELNHYLYLIHLLQIFLILSQLLAFSIFQIEIIYPLQPNTLA